MPFVEIPFSIKDVKIKIHIGVFYSGVDQYNVSGGGSAYSVLVVAIINCLYKNLGLFPTKIKFDKVLKSIILEYIMFLEDEMFKSKFPYWYFDIKALLDRKIRPLTLSIEYSGWF